MRIDKIKLIYILMVFLGLLGLLTINHIKTEHYGKYYTVLTFIFGLSILGLYLLIFFRSRAIIKEVGLLGFLYGMFKINILPYFILAFILSWYGNEYYMKQFENIPGMTDIKDGQYILNDHGEVAKVLTREEYYLYSDMERTALIIVFLFFGSVALLLCRTINNIAVNTLYKT